MSELKPIALPCAGRRADTTGDYEPLWLLIASSVPRNHSPVARASESPQPRHDVHCKSHQALRPLFSHLSSVILFPGPSLLFIVLQILPVSLSRWCMFQTLALLIPKHPGPPKRKKKKARPHFPFSLFFSLAFVFVHFPLLVSRGIALACRRVGRIFAWLFPAPRHRMPYLHLHIGADRAGSRARVVSRRCLGRPAS